MCTEKPLLAYESFLLEFCENITKVLFCSEAKRSLSDEDLEFIKKIHEYHQIDECSFSEKARTDFEVYIYSQCYSYVHKRFESESFDIGSGIDSINNFFELLCEKYSEEYAVFFPQTLSNIKDLVVIKLSTIDVASKPIDFSSQIKTINNKLKAIDSTTNELNGVTVKLQKKTKNIIDRLRETISKNSEFSKDIISIISIFAAIVLTMAGVFSFTSAVLENILSANIWCLSIVVLIFGIIFLTIFLGLFYFLYNVRHDVECYKLQSRIEHLDNDLTQSKDFSTNQKSSDQSKETKSRLEEMEEKLLDREYEIDKRLKKNRKFLLLPFIISICVMLFVLVGVIALVLFNDELTFNNTSDYSECTCTTTVQDEPASIETTDHQFETTPPSVDFGGT